MPISVNISGLTDALDWVSVGGGFENAAYINRHTGRIYFISDAIEAEEDQPEDFDDDTYLAVPDKKALDLGHRLIFRYFDKFLPKHSDTVRDYFRKKGAYSRFKDLLDRHNHLEPWYKFEAEAIEAALREWADDHNLIVAG